MTKERIEEIREAVVPFVKIILGKVNLGNVGNFVAEEFEKDFNEITELAIKGLEKEPCEDAVSRKAILDKIKEVCFSKKQEWINFRISQGSHGQRDLIINFIEELPPVTPTRLIANIKIDKDELREICNERIEIECQHGMCKDCKYNVKYKTTTMCDIGNRPFMREPSTYYCADFERRE